MQIHEITFGAKKLNEGLLDTIKAATKAVTTSGTKALTSRVPYAQAKRDIDLSQAEKLRQQINAKYGVNVQGSKPVAPAPATGVPPATATGAPPAVNYKFKPPVTPGVAAQSSVPPTNNTNQILPRPGHVLRLVNPANKGVYFKDPNGIWYAPSQARGMPPQKITSQKSIDYLNNLADNGGATEIKNQAGKGI